VDALTTSDPTPPLTGTVDDPDAFIDVIAGGATYAAANNGDGTWTVVDNTMDPALAVGTYEVVVHATDVAGNVGTDATANELVVVSAAQPVYRFWSPVYSRHFYTIKVAERDKLINGYAHIWTYEGVAYQAFADNGPPGVAPIYRFWSDVLRAHFYTIKEAEKNKLINQFSHVWTYEGVAFYAYPEGSQIPGTSPVYRFWSDSLRCHFYTITEAEKDKLINNYSNIWTFEGIAWYAVPPSPVVPVAVDDRVSVSLGSTRYDLRTGRTSG
jgi:hypothetical protein